MGRIVLINGIVCGFCTVLGLLFAGASIISIANMTVPWREWLLGAALLVPAMFLISGIGAWLANSHELTQAVVGLIALPWVYLVIFVILMVVSFDA